METSIFETAFAQLWWIWLLIVFMWTVMYMWYKRIERLEKDHREERFEWRTSYEKLHDETAQIAKETNRAVSDLNIAVHELSNLIRTKV